MIIMTKRNIRPVCGNMSINPDRCGIDPYKLTTAGDIAMYERMLNKQETPTFDDLVRYSGACGKLWLALDKYLNAEFNAARLIRFPYGNNYGWSVKYSRKSTHICDIFAENGAFSALFQISATAVESVYDSLDLSAQKAWEDKSPCGGGGWIDFRVLDDVHLQDLKKLIYAKVTMRSK